MAGPIQKAASGLSAELEDGAIFDDVHVPSFGFGVISSLMLVLVYKVVRGTAKLALKLALVALVMALWSSGYFGFLRKG